MNKEKSCGAVIVRKNKDVGYEYLLIRQLSGHWGFPKGHVEMNENEQDTALREIREETGLSVKLDTDFRDEISYHLTPNVVKNVVYFIGVPVSGMEKPQEIEVSELRWVDIDGARELITYPQVRSVLMAAEEYLAQMEKVN